MKVFAATGPNIGLVEIAEHARRAEDLGFDGLHVPEARHDPMLLSAVALAATTTLTVRTSVVVAFARSPMVLAYGAWDLAKASAGRFELGLGTQVRGNLEGRFSITWTDPIGRMREYVAAVRSCWASFQDGTPLHVVGEHYQLTRLQPFFNPGPIDHPDIPIYVAAINPGMAAVAGQCADGVIAHPTAAHPLSVARLRGAVGTGVAVAVAPPAVVAETADGLATGREQVRRTLAFLYSTPAYWTSLEPHGWADRGPRLRRLVADGKWEGLAELVDDEMLSRLTLCTTWSDLPGAINARYASTLDCVVLPGPTDGAADDVARTAIAAIRS